MRHLLANWGAALKLPFVYLGWARDFWKDFEHYPALEAGLPSTFFVIPFQGKPGRGSQRRLGASGTSFRLRRSPISKTASTVLAQPGARSDCTESMHGVTARKPVRRWSSFSASRQSENRGVRMHWLYFDQQSPAVLDKAGADYDSTAGYNEAIGYRAGTAQAYKPLKARTPPRAASNHHGYGAVLSQASGPVSRSRRAVRCKPFWKCCRIAEAASP